MLISALCHLARKARAHASATSDISAPVQFERCLPCLQLSTFELLEQLSVNVGLEHCMFVAPVNECHLLVR